MLRPQGSLKEKHTLNLTREESSDAVDETLTSIALLCLPQQNTNWTSYQEMMAKQHETYSM
jgi:hypothetical protein